MSQKEKAPHNYADKNKEPHDAIALKVEIKVSTKDNKPKFKKTYGRRLK